MIGNDARISSRQRRAPKGTVFGSSEESRTKEIAAQRALGVLGIRFHWSQWAQEAMRASPATENADESKATFRPAR